MKKPSLVWLYGSLLAGLLGCSQTAVPSATPTVVAAKPLSVNLPGLQVGETLPWREFTTIAGHKVSMQNGQRQLLIFFATWCSDSQRVMRQLMASPLVQQADLQIIGIGREEDAATLSSFARVYQLDFALVSDPDRNLYREVAEKGIPQLVTVDPTGQVRQVLLGEVPDAISLLHW